MVGHLVNNHVIIEAAKVGQYIIPSQVVLHLLGERKRTGTDVKYVIEQCEPLMQNDAQVKIWMVFTIVNQLVFKLFLQRYFQ